MAWTWVGNVCLIFGVLAFASAEPRKGDGNYGPLDEYRPVMPPKVLPFASSEPRKGNGYGPLDEYGPFMPPNVLPFASSEPRKGGDGYGPLDEYGPFMPPNVLPFASSEPRKGESFNAAKYPGEIFPRFPGGFIPGTHDVNYPPLEKDRYYLPVEEHIPIRGFPPVDTKNPPCPPEPFPGYIGDMQPPSLFDFSYCQQRPQPEKTLIIVGDITLVHNNVIHTVDGVSGEVGPKDEEEQPSTPSPPASSDEKHKESGTTATSVSKERGTTAKSIEKQGGTTAVPPKKKSTKKNKREGSTTTAKPKRTRSLEPTKPRKIRKRTQHGRKSSPAN